MVHRGLRHSTGTTPNEPPCRRSLSFPRGERRWAADDRVRKAGDPEPPQDVRGPPRTSRPAIGLPETGDRAAPERSPSDPTEEDESTSRRCVRPALRAASSSASLVKADARVSETSRKGSTVPAAPGRDAPAVPEKSAASRRPSRAPRPSARHLQCRLPIGPLSPPEHEPGARSTNPRVDTPIAPRTATGHPSTLRMEFRHPAPLQAAPQTASRVPALPRRPGPDALVHVPARRATHLD